MKMKVLSTIQDKVAQITRARFLSQLFWVERKFATARGETGRELIQRNSNFMGSKPVLVFGCWEKRALSLKILVLTTILKFSIIIRNYKQF